MLPFLPHLIAMLGLMGASAFFSSSEAALFYVRREDRQRMAHGSAGERAAIGLLRQPERLLTSILFWNLVINIVYFALATVVAMGLERAGDTRAATVVALGALLAIIVFSEMLPKNLGVLWPRRIAGLVGLPLAAATRVLDPVLPGLEKVSAVSRRIVAPGFLAEPYMDLADLERAISLSGDNQELVDQEQAILSRIVALSDVPVEDIIRPRRDYVAFTPPVQLSDLSGARTPSGYVLVTEPDSEEIAASLPLDRAALLDHDARLDHHAQPVIVAPWCAAASTVLDELRTRNCRVAAVVNELGETIGVTTIEELMAEVLQRDPASRHPRDRPGFMRQTSDGVWAATGRTTLRRVFKQFDLPQPASKARTVAGLVQEQLRDIPTDGAEVVWGDLHWRVTQVGEDDIVVELRSDGLGGESETTSDF